MGIYYESDQVVEEDQELQDFVKDVYMYGMRGKKASGRPQQLCVCDCPRGLGWIPPSGVLGEAVPSWRVCTTISPALAEMRWTAGQGAGVQGLVSGLSSRGKGSAMVLP